MRLVWTCSSQMHPLLNNFHQSTSRAITILCCDFLCLSQMMLFNLWFVGIDQFLCDEFESKNQDPLSFVMTFVTLMLFTFIFIFYFSASIRLINVGVRDQLRIHNFWPNSMPKQYNKKSVTAELYQLQLLDHHKLCNQKFFDQEVSFHCDMCTDSVII